MGPPAPDRIELSMAGWRPDRRRPGDGTVGREFRNVKWLESGVNSRRSHSDRTWRSSGKSVVEMRNVGNGDLLFHYSIIPVFPRLRRSPCDSIHPIIQQSNACADLSPVFHSSTNPSIQPSRCFLSSSLSFRPPPVPFSEHLLPPGGAEQEGKGSL
jgi:hypothetical protein